MPYDRRDAFHSVYYLFRNKLSPFFYLKHTLFTVLFLAPGIGGYKRFTAIIGSSTPGLRQTLTKESIGIFQFQKLIGFNTQRGTIYFIFESFA